MRRAVVPAAQALTATAAVFTVVMACGYPSPPPSTAPARGRVPDVPLDGIWDGTIEPPPEPQLGVRVVIVSEGQVPVPTMNYGQDVYLPSRAPASRHTGTDFVLTLRKGDRLVTLTGRITPDRRVMSGTVAGFSPNPRRFVLYRTR